jgi:ribonuclease inhibitor
MPVKRCTLEGREIGSLDDFYDRLADGLPLPKHFGRNLDALWDALSTDVEGPFEIVWKRADESRKRMGSDFDRIVSLLREVEEERDDITLTVE